MQPRAAWIVSLVIAGCTHAQPAGPLPARLPRPGPGPAPRVTPLPPAPAPPTAPAGSPAPRAPANAPAPLEFHVQFSDRGDRPGTQGLSASIALPAGIPVYRDRVAIVYEWRPDDGREKLQNPLTGRAWGPIWKDDVAEQLGPANMDRHLDSLDEWIGVYVPREFTGVVCLDVERFSLRDDAFHLSPAVKARAQRLFPARTNASLVAEFMRRTEARARALRPNVSAWGWWGMGTVHPGYILWNAREWEAQKQHGRRDLRDALVGTAVPMPVFYFADALPKADDRAASLREQIAYWEDLFGRERLERQGYAYVNATHAQGPREGQILTRAEFRECVDAALKSGCRHVVVWAAIDSVATRDHLRQFVQDAFTPTVLEALRDEARR